MSRWFLILEELHFLRVNLAQYWKSGGQTLRTREQKN